MRTALFGVAVLLLGGCNDALIYGERTGFNLAIRVNDDPATPVNVNAGLQRSVVSVSPPLGGQIVEQNRTVPSGESVSAIARFDLKYDEVAGSPLAGKLTVRTQFLSGEAAVLATANPATAVRAVQLVTMGRFVTNSSAADKLNAFLGTPPDRAKAAQLRECSDKIARVKALSLAVFEIPNSDRVTEAERQQIVSCLKLDNQG